MTLYSVKGTETRPTSDFVKENLFNIIRDDVRGAAFLDLFAGTGAIGIEALSRGAKHATFVDISQKSIDVIRRNLDKARLAERAVVMKENAQRAVKKLAEQKCKYHLIYADPPYHEGLLEQTLNCIVAHGILADGGYIVVEMSKANALPEIHGLQIFKEKEYSGSRLAFLARPADTPS